MDEVQPVRPRLNKDQVWGGIIGSVVIGLGIIVWWIDDQWVRAPAFLQTIFPWVLGACAIVLPYNLLLVYFDRRPPDKPRLGVGLRTLIVVTVAWMVIGSTYFWMNDMGGRYQRAYDWEYLCRDLRKENPAQDVVMNECRDATQKMSDEARASSSRVWQQTVLMCAFAALIAWILVSIIYGCVRWIIAGNRSKPETGA